MKIKVQKNGTVSIPKRVLEGFDLRPGDTVDLGKNAGNLVLSPRRPVRRFKAKTVHDPITGLPSISAGPDAPILTHELVDEILNGTIRDIPDPRRPRRGLRLQAAAIVRN